ncbi:dihydropteroate synthase [Rhizobium sp. EC-SD404]|uniref:dihydropteroate synthase n=1 Tax=Rhizobium sp. EC-SD404 TaxID=2038389 RepID=UPI00125513B4|nr:dihydropteroate synthase [Rhizobium sp. EC-SD404]VVT22909.1 Dihydropteroate synthase [Rhizobium sp. EC-SD404]
MQDQPAERPDRWTWRVGHGREIDLSRRGVLMGVLNVTSDSFSDGGRFSDVAAALAEAQAMADAGATIIDVGGESTRPGAEPVDAETEQARVLPVITALAERFADNEAMLISVDSYRVETARLALEAGAHIINDISGLQGEPGMAELARETGAGLVVMHTGRGREKLPDVIEDQMVFLGRSLELAEAAGVDARQIVLDPGFGFAKDNDDNFALMARFGALHAFGRPFLVGTSRKRFLGAATGREAGERDVATAATTALLRAAGARIFRVHDVAKSRDALSVTEAMCDRLAQETGSDVS